MSLKSYINLVLSPDDKRVDSQFLKIVLNKMCDNVTNAQNTANTANSKANTADNKIGNLNSLTTRSKNSLVDAINSLNSPTVVQLDWNAEQEAYIIPPDKVNAILNSSIITFVGDAGDIISDAAVEGSTTLNLLYETDSIKNFGGIFTITKEEMPEMKINNTSVYIAEVLEEVASLEEGEEPMAYPGEEPTEDPTPEEVVEELEEPADPVEEPEEEVEEVISITSVLSRANLLLDDGALEEEAEGCDIELPVADIVRVSLYPNSSMEEFQEEEEEGNENDAIDWELVGNMEAALRYYGYTASFYTRVKYNSMWFYCFHNSGGNTWYIIREDKIPEVTAEEVEEQEE